MDLSLAALIGFARETLAQPRQAARRVMALDLPLRDAWAALFFTAAASTVLFHLGLALLPEEARLFDVPPFATFAMQVTLLVLSTLLVWHVGMMRGGKGNLPEAVSLMAWLQFVLLLVQALQIIAEVILPPLAVLLAFAAMAIFLWLLTNFVAELHGFPSLVRVFFAILAVGFILSLALAVVLTFIIPMPA